MSRTRIHTCLPATDDGRMSEYGWSEVALAQNTVVYVPVIGSFPTTLLANATAKLSPSEFVLWRPSKLSVNVVPGRFGTCVMRQYCSSSLARPPVDDHVSPTLSKPPVVVEPLPTFCVRMAILRKYVPGAGTFALTSIALTVAQFVVPVCAVDDHTCCPSVGAPLVVSTNAYRTTFPPPVAPKASTFQSRFSWAVKGGEPLAEVPGSCQSAYVHPPRSEANAPFVVAPDWTGSVNVYSRTCS